MAKDMIEMEDLSNIPDFGISGTTAIDANELEDLILGGSTTSNPDDVTTIQASPSKQPPAKETPSQEVPKVEENLEESILEDVLKDENEGVTTKTKELLETSEDSSDEDVNQFEALSNDLFELGIFTKSDDEESPKTPEEFKERFVKEVANQANAQVYNFLMQKHGQEGVDMFNSIFVNGVSPEQYLQAYAKIESLQNIDIEKEPNQERVYRTYYKKLGWSDDKIDSKLQKLKDYGDLADEAKEIHEKLIEQEQQDFERAEQQSIQNQRRIATERAQYGQSINQILVDKLKDKEFDGIPLTDKVAREAFDELYTEKFQLPNGEKLTEFDRYILELRRPENYETKIKLWLLAKNNFDLSKVKAKALAKESNKLFNSLATKEKVQKRSSGMATNNDFTSFL